MKSILLRLVLPLAALAFVAPAASFAQKGKNDSGSSPSSPVVIPGGNVTETYVISTSGSYVLGGNRVMGDGAKHVIVISAADVTLDLAGHTLSYASGVTGGGYAINVPLAVNVEIRNGSIARTPHVAIGSLEHSGSGLRVIDLRLSDTGGIHSYGQNTHIERCAVFDTSVYAAIYLGGNGGSVINCQVRDVPDGIGIYVQGGSRVVGNTVFNTKLGGIYVSAASSQSGSLVLENSVQSANNSRMALAAGIQVHGTAIQVRNNAIGYAGTFGIWCDGTGNLVEGNVVGKTRFDTANVRGHGILSSSDTNVVRNNCGAENSGEFLSGSYTNGGGNFGN